MISHHSLNLHFPEDEYVEHLFMCLFTFYISSLVKYFFMSFIHFLIGLFVFFYSSILSILYIF